MFLHWKLYLILVFFCYLKGKVSTMKNKKQGSIYHDKNAHICDDENSHLNISQSKVRIDATSKEKEAHMLKKGKSNRSSKKSFDSNGVQVLNDKEIIGSKIQDDASALSNTVHSGAGHPLGKNSFTVLSLNHFRDEKHSNGNSSFYVEELSSEDEVYTCQCPKNYIKQDLVNHTFDFGKLNKMADVKTNEVLQLSVLSTSKKWLTMALPSKTEDGVLIKLPLKGHILIKKIVETPFPDQLVTNESTYKSEIDDKLLKDLKVRHPLLGINWKAHIDLADEAFKRQHMFEKTKRRKEKREMKIQLKEEKIKHCKRKLKEDFKNESLHLKKKIKIK